MDVPEGVCRECGGYGEHFDWHADQLAVERRRLHELLVRRGDVRDAAYDARRDSFHARSEVGL